MKIYEDIIWIYDTQYCQQYYDMWVCQSELMGYPQTAILH